MTRPNAEDRRIPPAGARFDYISMDDGAQLRTAHWPSHSGPDADVIVFQTGRTEFIEKCFETVHDLLDRDFSVYMMDWRGQGLSDRLLPDRHKGHIDSYDTYLSDFNRFVVEVVLPDAPRKPFLLAHSMGGHITLRHLHDHPDHFEAAIFTAPMIDIAIPAIMRPFTSGLSRLMKLFAGSDAWAPGQSGYNPDALFDGNMLTTDPDRFADMAVACDHNPDLAIGGITVSWLLETMKSVKVLNKADYLKAIQTPILLQYGTEDRLVSTDAICRAGSILPNAGLLQIEGAMHEILKEQDACQEIFWNAVDAFLETIRRSGNL